ncbi:hypothetical protein NPIL_632681 [Nephila pilipes]|uniref:Uncharacterized protein n=1 Tax=Nephila pilipes TaxID=299642 RepID=A0A8X6PGS6_NEPPI|nr:hypothetical protein NPIL_632681 [Nephila pilipes]
MFGYSSVETDKTGIPDSFDGIEGIKSFTPNVIFRCGTKDFRSIKLECTRAEIFFFHRYGRSDEIDQSEMGFRSPNIADSSFAFGKFYLGASFSGLIDFVMRFLYFLGLKDIKGY